MHNRSSSLRQSASTIISQSRGNFSALSECQNKLRFNGPIYQQHRRNSGTSKTLKNFCILGYLLNCRMFQVVPLMDHPSETFLNELESHLMIQVFSNTQIIISSCISSLAAVVNKITKNYKLIRDCFKRYEIFFFLNNEHLNWPIFLLLDFIHKV